jgi:hypothetical protein
LDWVYLFFSVHIHSCGNGHLGFRSYSESLGKPQVTKGSCPWRSVQQQKRGGLIADLIPGVSAM